MGVLLWMGYEKGREDGEENFEFSILNFEFSLS
jgi:hypothetical protein